MSASILTSTSAGNGSQLKWRSDSQWSPTIKVFSKTQF
ncbi:hypothetical protein SynSYN20_02510 [Synechococcus sp. SYN20]|nr:hypothetical protein SynSYN20_02510 [Synechococcus sp. SYN20]